ncbi:hypothetical protein A2U01_0054195, partial [Trifolium medium]|nr:hypothetical protein [Trifolium medium]
MWESLRNDINADLDRIQNGDLNELMEFQKNRKEWVEGVNREFETAQLKKKEPKTLFVKKEVFDHSEFDSFKDEVNEKLSTQESQIS